MIKHPRTDNMDIAVDIMVEFSNKYDVGLEASIWLVLYLIHKST